MTRQIALLRGINVGSARRVAMADLRGLLSKAGYEDVKTLGQSGNVVLSAKLADPERLGSKLESQVAKGLGVKARVVVRTREELAAVVMHNPLGEIAKDLRRYQVSFLSAVPNSEAIAEIAATNTGPERWVAKGREIYAWHPDGIHNSPLAKLISEERLGVVVTARNWNTVTKLLALADACEWVVHERLTGNSPRLANRDVCPRARRW
jgi:uncharacterized protein (DUF1697 family)